MKKRYLIEFVCHTDWGKTEWTYAVVRKSWFSRKRIAYMNADCQELAILKCVRWIKENNGVLDFDKFSI